MSILEILECIDSQLKEGYCILPSELSLSEKEYNDIKALAQERFPSIPLDILGTLAQKNQTCHL
jgi:hypothetical protein